MDSVPLEDDNDSRFSFPFPLFVVKLVVPSDSLLLAPVSSSSSGIDCRAIFLANCLRCLSAGGGACSEDDIATEEKPSRLLELSMLVPMLGLAVRGFLVELELVGKVKDCWRGDDIVNEVIGDVGAGEVDRWLPFGLESIELGLELGSGIKGWVP